MAKFFEKIKEIKKFKRNGKVNTQKNKLLREVEDEELKIEYIK